MTALRVDHSLLAKLATYPGLPADAEVVLHPTETGAIVSVRREGGRPTVLALDSDRACELHPQDDADLPGAHLLADPRQLAAQLEPRLGPIVGAHLVAWHPGRSAVSCVQTLAGPRVWLKLLDRTSHRHAKSALMAVQSTVDPLVLQRPTFVLDDVCGLLSEDAAGVALRTLMARGEELPMALLSRAVLALSYTTTLGELPIHDASRLRDAALVAVCRGSRLVPALEELSAPLAHATLPATLRTTFVHGNLHDQQLFLARSRVSLIGLDGIALGDPRIDFATLAEHLRLHDLQLHGCDRGLADRFLSRCGHAAHEPELIRLRSLVRARLCGTHALRPRQAALVEQLRVESLAMLQANP